MSTASVSAVPADTAKVASGVTFPRLIRSEFAKFYRLRSTSGLVVGSAAVIIGIGLYNTTGSVSTTLINLSNNAPHPTPWNVLYGVPIAALLVAVLGILVIASEFGSRSIVSTLVAAPKRVGVFAAKAMVLLMTTAITTVLATAVVMVYNAVQFSAHDLANPVSPAQAIGLCAASAAYLAAISLIGLGVGAVIRNSAGSVAALLSSMFVLAITIPAAMGPEGGPLSGLSLTTIGTVLTAGPVQLSALPLSTGAAWAWLGAWALITGAVGVICLRRRDV